MSDYTRDVVQLYGIKLKDFAGLKGYTVAKRSIFVIDSKGTIQYRWVSEDPSAEPNYTNIQEKLSKIG